MLDLLHSYFKISGEDDERTRREKVAGKITILERSLEDTLPYLFSLLGIVEGEDPLAQMDGQLKKRRTLEAIKRIILRESLNQPLMVIFEDLHWIDEATQEFLNLLGRLARHREDITAGELSSRILTSSGIARPTIRNSDSTRSARRVPKRCCRRCWVTARIWFRSSGLSSRGPKATPSSWKRWCRCCSRRVPWYTTALR